MDGWSNASNKSVQAIVASDGSTEKFVDAWDASAYMHTAERLEGMSNAANNAIALITCWTTLSYKRTACLELIDMAQMGDACRGPPATVGPFGRNRGACAQHCGNCHRQLRQHQKSAQQHSGDGNLPACSHRTVRIALTLVWLYVACILTPHLSLHGAFQCFA